MTQMDQLKKRIDNIIEIFESLEKLNGLLPHDKQRWECYVSVKKMIEEIEANDLQRAEQK